MYKQWFITACAFFALGTAIGWWAKGSFKGPNSPIAAPPPPEFATVKRIIDGITIELDSGHYVRYLGVRTPNVNDQIQCFGKEAVLANESIVNQRVRLEEDPVLLRARDGAWVRYVYLIQGEVDGSPTPAPSKNPPSPSLVREEPTSPPDKGEQKGVSSSSPNLPSTSPELSPIPTEPEDEKDIFINERIIEGGFGFPVVSQDMRYGEKILSAARYASATGKGLWKQCEVTEKEGQFATQVVDKCIIKGVVTRDLQKIYRTPDCPGYSQTVVVESQGGRWFCAEDISRDEGWEKGKDCPS